MAILVTGGAGYIGSHTCLELLKNGYELIILDNFSNSKPESLYGIKEISRKNFKFYQTDLPNRNELEHLFKENTIEAVIHLAGLKAVSESVSIPLHYYLHNVTGTLILCDVMRKHGVNKLVFSSSAAVYGISDRVPIKEDFPLRATNPYGRSKQMIEQILKDIYISNKSWSIVILRYFNPIGADESGRIGEECPSARSITWM
jgi:UDP-glucose 4-epimerase